MAKPINNLHFYTPTVDASTNFVPHVVWDHLLERRRDDLSSIGEDNFPLGTKKTAPAIKVKMSKTIYSRDVVLRLLQRSSSHQNRALHASQFSCQKVSLDSIKQLRARTGAPINAVKKALEEQNGDMEAAIDHLRKLGASMVAKKAHRDASEGLVTIAVSPDQKSAAIVEINSETDFVARTPKFGELVRSVAMSALGYERETESGLLTLDVDRVLAMDGNAERLHSTVSSLGENIVLKRAMVLQADPTESIFGYVHGTVSDNCGKIGVLVALTGDGVEEIGPRLAMHIAAASPNYASIGRVPEAHVAKERELLIETAKAEQKDGRPKPPEVVRKMAEGRLRKWYSEVVLEEQELLVEGSYTGKPRSVAKAMKAEVGNACVTRFARFAVGERLES